MIPFDPKDPFPLLPEGSFTYADAQEHAAKVDEFLGFETARIEEELWNSERRAHNRTRPREHSEHQRLWIGLPVQALLTPYVEIRGLLEILKPEAGSTVIDLGAAYGRMGFVIGRHFPEVSFIGYEYVGARVREGQRILEKFNYPQIHIVRADLAADDFKLEDADIYFIYDYGTSEAIQKTLEDLKEKARAKPIIVVGRGRASRDIIERQHPWLSQVIKPEHLKNSSLYRSS